MKQQSDHIDYREDKVEVYVPTDMDEAAALYNRNAVFHAAINIVIDNTDVQSTYGITGLLHHIGGECLEFKKEELCVR